jgi:hypothetical protein
MLITNYDDRFHKICERFDDVNALKHPRVIYAQRRPLGACHNMPRTQYDATGSRYFSFPGRQPSLSFGVRDYHGPVSP